jgi:DNA-binding SARP family transcriptional activator
MGGRSVVHPTRRASSHRTALRGRLALTLLGGFELARSGRSVTVPLSVERLLAFVALQNRPVNRSFAAGTLWPETTDERAGANLRSALWRLRRISPSLVEASPTHLRLGPGTAVDTHQLSSLIWRILDPSKDPANEDLLHLCVPSDLLPGWYDEWVLVERERIRQLRLHALETLCERLAERRRFGPAVEAGLCAVQEEPLRESAQRALIRAYLAEGNACEAIRQYRRYRQLLDDELGLKPSAELTEMVRPLTVASARR